MHFVSANLVYIYILSCRSAGEVVGFTSLGVLFDIVLHNIFPQIAQNRSVSQSVFPHTFLNLASLKSPFFGKQCNKLIHNKKERIFFFSTLTVFFFF